MKPVLVLPHALDVLVNRAAANEHSNPTALLPDAIAGRMAFDADQVRAWDSIRDGKSVFITGGAGSGKVRQ